MNEPLLTAEAVTQELKKLGDTAKATLLARYFKTGKGEYGEGDTFVGITVPVQRKIAHRSLGLPLSEISTLLAHPIHECRFTALEILVEQFARAFKRGDKKECARIVKFYLARTQHINNWDLVDTSALYIIGAYLFEFNQPRTVLYTLAHSRNLWERRIALLSTFYFIRQQDFKDSIKLAELLLDDPHDLIHKAVGWMLREVGKQGKKTLVRFLDKHAHHMPRTMLRYSLEKFDATERARYMNLVAQ